MRSPAALRVYMRCMVAVCFPISSPFFFSSVRGRPCGLVSLAKISSGGIEVGEAGRLVKEGED